MVDIRRPGEVSLERALSKLGITSRTEARQWIRDGRVSVNNRVTTDPGRPVVPERVTIAVDDTVVDRRANLTIAFHKPRGVVTTRVDPEQRPTVYDSLAEVGRHLAPVGRLDLASTGLLLLTSDTRLGAWLTDPSSEVPRVYIVTVRGRLQEDGARTLEEGVDDRGERLTARHVDVLKASNRETHLRVTLVEGKNREIRRLMKALGHEVTRLKRVSIGGIELGDLAPGKWRIVSAEELNRAFPSAPPGYSRAASG